MNVGNILNDNPHLRDNPFMRGIQYSSNNHNRNNRNRLLRGERRNHFSDATDTTSSDNNQCRVPANQTIVDKLEEMATECRYLRDAMKVAIRNIKQYEHPIINKKTALKVRGIGPKIADIIAKHLKAIREESRQRAHNNSDLGNNNITKRQKAKKIYIPKRRSGGWGLLYYMYITWKKTGNDKFRKEELQNGAQEYCDESYRDGQVCDNSYNSYHCVSITTFQ